MNILSANSPRCLLERAAKILLSFSAANASVELAPPPAAFDLDLAFASQPNPFSALAPTLILLPHFFYIVRIIQVEGCRTDTAIRPRRCPETRTAADRKVHAYYAPNTNGAGPKAAPLFRL